MSQFFQFESDFVNSLRCIPMQVRLKLDTCGVKMKLSHWNLLTQEERKVLVSMACETSTESTIYRDFLQQIITEKTGEPAKNLPIEENPAWLKAEEIPQTVQEKASEFDISLSLENWQTLTPLQRFALIKLSRPSHENNNFYPALQEFGLISGQ